ncbi:MYND finger domain containing protein, variant 2 [Balamuthia mandrillaris]
MNEAQKHKGEKPFEDEAFLHRKKSFAWENYRLAATLPLVGGRSEEDHQQQGNGSRSTTTTTKGLCYDLSKLGLRAGELSHAARRECSNPACRKREAEVVAEGGERFKLCSWCRAQGRIVPYCCRRCQNEDWVRRHRQLCCKNANNSNTTNTNESNANIARTNASNPTEPTIHAKDTEQSSAAPPYLLELMHNLQCFHLVVRPPVTSPASSSSSPKNKAPSPMRNMRAEVTADAVLLYSAPQTKTKEEQQPLHRIELQGAVVKPDQATVQQLSDCLSLKLPIVSLPVEEQHIVHPRAQEQRSVAPLPTPTQLSALYCRFCGCSLFARQSPPSSFSSSTEATETSQPSSPCSSEHTSSPLPHLQQHHHSHTHPQDGHHGHHSCSRPIFSPSPSLLAAAVGHEATQSVGEGDDVPHGEEGRNGAIIEKVFSLPSLHWVELSDEWSCGNCCAFVQFPRGEIKALPYVCFVSDAFLLLHSSQLNVLSHPSFRAVLGITTEGSESEWQYAHCKECQLPLGLLEMAQAYKGSATEASGTTTTYSSQAGGVRLFKHAISTAQRGESTSNIFREDCLETFCSYFLLDSACTHTCFRYVVCSSDESSQQDRLHLLLILQNWDSSIYINDGSLWGALSLPFSSPPLIFCLFNNKNRKRIVPSSKAALL